MGKLIYNSHTGDKKITLTKIIPPVARPLPPRYHLWLSTDFVIKTRYRSFYVYF